MFNWTGSNPHVTRRAGVRTNIRFVGTTTLIEDDAYDAAGKFLGKIEEIVIETGTGCVRYAVLGLGGFLGIGRKRFAIPWSALTPDVNHRRCVVKLTPVQLMAGSIPDDDAWLQRTDPT